jgi:hypothetical protein
MSPPTITTSSTNASDATRAVNPSTVGQTPIEVAYHQARAQHDLAMSYRTLAERLDKQATEAMDRVTTDTRRRQDLHNESTAFSNLAEEPGAGSKLWEAYTTNAESLYAEMIKTAESAVRQDELSIALMARAATYQVYSFAGDGNGSVPLRDAEEMLNSASRAFAKERNPALVAEESKGRSKVRFRST